MQLRADIQLQSMHKAMVDVVLPAIDPANSLAMEQAQLVVGMLGLMQQQLPLQYRFDRDELGRLLPLMQEVVELSESNTVLAPVAEQLVSQLAHAKAVHDGSQVEPAQLLEAVKDSRYLISALVRAAGKQGDADETRKIEQAVLAYSKAQLLRDRAMVAAQGWEPDPSALPTITSLLDQQEHENA